MVKLTMRPDKRKSTEKIKINFARLWARSGQEYQTYALQYPQYKETNQALVALATLKSGDTVVDVACGTGLTTQEILLQCPHVGKIYAIDFSEDMLAVARDAVNSDKVTFIVADVTTLEQVVGEEVDIVVCNSSFWQFHNQEKVLRAIAHILKEEGTFVFNLNQQFFDFGETEPIQKEIIDIIFAEMRKHGLEPKGKLAQKASMEDIQSLCQKNGCKIVQTSIIDIGPRSLDDFFAFLKIPATATFFEGVPVNMQKEILQTAYVTAQEKCGDIPHNRWINFVCKKAR